VLLYTLGPAANINDWTTAQVLTLQQILSTENFKTTGCLFSSIVYVYRDITGDKRR